MKRYTFLVVFKLDTGDVMADEQPVEGARNTLEAFSAILNIFRENVIEGHTFVPLAITLLREETIHESN